MSCLIPNHDALLMDPLYRQQEWDAREDAYDLAEERADMEEDGDDDE